MDRVSSAVTNGYMRLKGWKPTYEPRYTLFILLPVFFLGIFYFYPLASIFSVSFLQGSSGVNNSIQQALASPSLRRTVSFTFSQALISTLATLIAGIPGAYLFGRYKFRGKSLLRAITSIPFILPTLVVAAGFSALLGPSGWINIGLMRILGLDSPPIQFMHSYIAIIVGHIFYNLTIVLRLVGDYWSHIDSRIEQAALIMGANRWETFRYITIPLLKPAVITAALLIFIFDFTSFGVVLIMGGASYATIEVEIFYQTVSLFNLPLAAVLSILQLGTTFLLTILYTRMLSTISQPIKQRKPIHNQMGLGNNRKKLMALTISIALIVFTSAPLVSLVSRSFIALESRRDREGVIEQGFTLDFYKELTSNRRESQFYAPPTAAVGFSLLFASITVVISLSVGLPASLALAREEKSRLIEILDPLIMLPLGTSAVTLGLGFIIALGKPPLDLRTSPLLIPIAHSLVALPFVIRSLTPALRRIKPRIRDAASIMGASPGQVIRRIDIPLIGRALIVSAAFAFMISMGEFGATSLITRPEYPTIPIVIYRFFSRPGALNLGQAYALSTILMIVSIIAIIAIERFRVADIGEF